MLNVLCVSSRSRFSVLLLCASVPTDLLNLWLSNAVADKLSQSDLGISSVYSANAGLACNIIADPAALQTASRKAFEASVYARYNVEEHGGYGLKCFDSEFSKSQNISSFVFDSLGGPQTQSRPPPWRETSLLAICERDRTPRNIV